MADNGQGFADRPHRPSTLKATDGTVPSPALTEKEYLDPPAPSPLVGNIIGASITDHPP